VFIFTALVVVLCSFHAIERWPSEDYVDAMSRGQYERARMHLSAQVQEGNPKAQTALANLHYLGLGGPADLDEAASLYHMAASKGFGAAQLNMGHLYKQGLGVAKDVERAFGWYMHANISNSVWAEYYMNQISVELTLSPLQMSVVKDRWSKLIDLASEPL
jgi:TPR repeat protein